MPCYSPLKGWRDDETGGIQFRPSSGAREMEVACGQCLGCRLDRSRMWAFRIVHEASLYQFECGNSFVTLTYRDQIECNDEQLANGFHIPDDWSLHKAHFQKFMKRLRKVFPQKIRFFHCGEYGQTCKHGLSLVDVGCPLCNVGRPHYHAILFNCSFPDLEKYSQVNGEDRFTSPLLEKIWKYGFVDVGQVTFESAAYVARYCLKKVTGAAADDYYLSVDLNGEARFLEPEYCTMSRGRACGRHDTIAQGIGAGCKDCSGGIGRRWYEAYKEDLFPSDEVPVPGSGVFKKVPRYYAELFEDENPLGMEEIKELRKKFREEHASEYSPSRLMAKYKCQKARAELLKRTV